MLQLPRTAVGADPRTPVGAPEEVMLLSCFPRPRSKSSAWRLARCTDDFTIIVVDMETSQTIECFLDQRVRVGEGADRQV